MNVMFWRKKPEPKITIPKYINRKEIKEKLVSILGYSECIANDRVDDGEFCIALLYKYGLSVDLNGTWFEVYSGAHDKYLSSNLNFKYAVISAVIQIEEIK